MKTWNTFAGLLAAPLLAAGLLHAQAPGATVHGHVNNTAGQSISKGDIKFTTDKTGDEKAQSWKYTFPLNATGDYTGSGIAPGDYFAYVVIDDKRIDRLPIVVKNGDNKLLNFDMTRKEFLDNMTAEDRAALEEYKKRTAEATQANAKIGNLNATLNTVRADLLTPKPNFDTDAQQMQTAITAKPDEALLYFVLGQVLVASADSASADARADHKSPMSDETIVKKYNDGIDAYKKGVSLSEEALAAKKKVNPADIATAWNSVGNAEAKLGKTTDAQAAFQEAAKANPPGAGMYYGNEAAVLFNSGQTDAAAAAADKAIAIDPNKPDPYFIRGQALIQKATVDKTGKIVAPPGCVEAYQKYLELAPDGRNAATVKEILASMGQTVNTKYKAGKK
jgi:tetratricopeptide (TPR) repeat protein